MLENQRFCLSYQSPVTEKFISRLLKNKIVDWIRSEHQHLYTCHTNFGTFLDGFNEGLFLAKGYPERNPVPNV